MAWRQTAKMKNSKRHQWRGGVSGAAWRHGGIYRRKSGNAHGSARAAKREKAKTPRAIATGGNNNMAAWRASRAWRDGRAGGLAQTQRHAWQHLAPHHGAIISHYLPHPIIISWRHCGAALCADRIISSWRARHPLSHAWHCCCCACASHLIISFIFVAFTFMVSLWFSGCVLPCWSGSWDGTALPPPATPTLPYPHLPPPPPACTTPPPAYPTCHLPPAYPTHPPAPTPTCTPSLLSFSFMHTAHPFSSLISSPPLLSLIYKHRHLLLAWHGQAHGMVGFLAAFVFSSCWHSKSIFFFHFYFSFWEFSVTIFNMVQEDNSLKT